MTKSLSQLKNQIKRLQNEVNSIESGVVNRIKKEIAKHGLTVEHLFGLSPSSAASAPANVESVARKSGAKFSDENGNSWSGFGPKPRWIREALEAGRSIEEFQRGRAKDATPANQKKAAKAAPKASKAPKFVDGAGNTWGGMGKRPSWLRAALESGKSLNDFLVTKSTSTAPKGATTAAAADQKTVQPTLAARTTSKAGKTARAAVPAKKLPVKPSLKAKQTGKKSATPKPAAASVKAEPAKASAAKKFVAAKGAKAPAAVAKEAKVGRRKPQVSNAARPINDSVAASDA